MRIYECFMLLYEGDDDKNREDVWYHSKNHGKYPWAFVGRECVFRIKLCEAFLRALAYHEQALQNKIHTDKPDKAERENHSDKCIHRQYFFIACILMIFSLNARFSPRQLLFLKAHLPHQYTWSIERNASKDNFRHRGILPGFSDKREVIHQFFQLLIRYSKKCVLPDWLSAESLISEERPEFFEMWIIQDCFHNVLVSIEKWLIKKYMIPIPYQETHVGSPVVLGHADHEHPVISIFRALPTFQIDIVLYGVHCFPVFAFWEELFDHLFIPRGSDEDTFVCCPPFDSFPRDDCNGSGIVSLHISYRFAELIGGEYSFSPCEISWLGNEKSLFLELAVFVHAHSSEDEIGRDVAEWTRSQVSVFMIRKNLLKKSHHGFNTWCSFFWEEYHA